MYLGRFGNWSDLPERLREKYPSYSISTVAKRKRNVDSRRNSRHSRCLGEVNNSRESVSLSRICLLAAASQVLPRKVKSSNNSEAKILKYRKKTTN